MSVCAVLLNLVEHLCFKPVIVLFYVVQGSACLHIVYLFVLIQLQHLINLILSVCFEQFKYELDWFIKFLLHVLEAFGFRSSQVQPSDLLYCPDVWSNVCPL
jgi:hypothetical protein